MVTPSTDLATSRSSSWWSVEEALTTISRSRIGPLATNPSMAKMFPPASPIAVASRPRTPGTLSSRTLRFSEYWASVDAVMERG